MFELVKWKLAQPFVLKSLQNLGVHFLLKKYLHMQALLVAGAKKGKKSVGKNSAKNIPIYYNEPHYFIRKKVL